MSSILLAHSPAGNGFPSLDIYSDDLELFKLSPKRLKYVTQGMNEPAELEAVYGLSYDDKKKLALMRCSAGDDSTLFGIQAEYGVPAKAFFEEMLREAKEEREYESIKVMEDAENSATRLLAETAFTENGFIVQSLEMNGDGAIYSGDTVIGLFNSITIDDDMRLTVRNSNVCLRLEKIRDLSIIFSSDEHSVRFYPSNDSFEDGKYFSKNDNLYSYNNLICDIEPLGKKADKIIKVPELDMSNVQKYLDECSSIIGKDKTEEKQSLFGDFDLF